MKLYRITDILPFDGERRLITDYFCHKGVKLKRSREAGRPMYINEEQLREAFEHIKEGAHSLKSPAWPKYRWYQAYLKVKNFLEKIDKEKK